MDNGFVLLRGTVSTECWPVAFRQRYSTAIEQLERALQRYPRFHRETL